MKKGAKPFQGASCEKRLKEWIKFLELTNYELFNKEDRTVEYFQWMAASGDKIIVLGNNADKHLKKVKRFKLPHPSFRNRKLNSKEYEKEQLELCKKWLTDGTR